MRNFIVFIAFAFTITSCKSRNPSEQQSSDSSQAIEQEINAQNWKTYAPTRPKQLQMCAAIRGNGNYIFAHWGAMARILEHYGPIQGVAGGSSGSATSFLYESIYLNPAVWTCGQNYTKCTELQSARRMAFLSKSLRDFIYILGDRVDFSSATTVIPKVVDRFQKSQYFSLIVKGELVKASNIAYKILSSPELGGIIDSNIAKRLKSASNSPLQLRRELDEINGSVQALNWTVDGTNMLMRRGLIDFTELARRIGITGDFYAGRNTETIQDIKNLLDECSEKSFGKEWSEIAKIPGPKLFRNPNFTCETYFKDILTKHFDKTMKTNRESSRLKDSVGKTIPALISTSIFNSTEADNKMRHFDLLYRNRNPQIGYTPKHISSEWLNFGYWGAAEDLKQVSKNQLQFKDLKTQKFIGIGPALWAEPLRVSPQEPGLGSALCNYEQGNSNTLGKWDSLSNLPESTQCHQWSLGGWSDLYPTQVLKNLGCENVVYVSRRDDEGDFIKSVAKLLTDGEKQWTDLNSQLFDLDNPQSSAFVGLANATATLCSDWNSVEAHQLECLQENAYKSPLQTRSTIFTGKAADAVTQKLAKQGFSPYAMVQSSPAIRGCMIGAKADSTKRPNPCKK